MPVHVDDMSMLRVYLRGILANAKHHGPGVDLIILALAGAIIARKDEGTSLEAQKGHSGDPANALRATIGGKRYAFSYNHDADCIDMKAGSSQGPVVHQFTNETPLEEIDRIIK